MAYPMGEADKGALRLDFDRWLMLQFRGSTITSDAGLLAYRELDDALSLTDTGADMLADARTGKNGRHRLAGPLRQSVFGRLAGYEDVNDAEWLCRDPAMRWVAGEKAITGYAPRPAKWGVSKRNGSADPRTLLLSLICPVSGLTRCAGDERRRPSCSTWIRVKARLTASRKVVPTMATLPAPVISTVRVQPVRRCRAVRAAAGQCA